MDNWDAFLYCPLPIANCLLPIAYCQLLIAYCFLASTGLPERYLSKNLSIAL